MSTLRVAAAQGVAVAGEIDTNVATAARLVRRAADEGAALVVLPEAFLTGYDGGAFAGKVPRADDLAGGWLDPLRDEAARGDLTVVVGTPLQRESAKALSRLVVRPSGEALAPYDKQHLFGEEGEHFVPGDHGATLAVGGWDLGLSVCYDACFPEHARAAADTGATAYLNSAAYFTGSEHRRDLYLAARALDNGLYAVFSGLTGTCGAATFNGGSAVYDPEGRPLVRLGTEEGVAVADLDPEVVRATREAHLMHADHRASLGPRVWA